MAFFKFHPVVHMLLATFFFSLMNLSVKFLPDVPAIEIILFRALVSLILSYALIQYKGLKPLGNNKKFLLLRGFFGMLSLTTFFLTLQNIPLASAVTLQYLSPIFTVLFAVFFLKEKVTALQWLCFAVAFCGVALIQGFDTRIEPLYLVLGILSAIFSGLAYNSVRKLKDSDHPLVVVFYFPLVALPISAVLCLFNWKTPVGIEWLWLILAGVFTQIAQINLTYALQHEKLAAISGLNYLGIIYALAFGYFIFNEQFNWWVLLGIFLVLTGVLLNFFIKTPKADKY
jgi:drug/metabolite transporter (DMT)-like permease